MTGFWQSLDGIGRTLLVIAGLLTALVLLELTGNVAGPEVNSLPTSGVAESLPDELTSVAISSDFPPVGTYSAILLRPLFEETRRPVQANIASAADSSSAAILKQKWRLSGIIIDAKNIAIMEATRSAETLSLIEGQAVDGWRVQEIDSNGLTLNRAGESLRFPLYEEDTSAAPRARKRNAQAWKPPD